MLLLDCHEEAVIWACILEECTLLGHTMSDDSSWSGIYILAGMAYIILSWLLACSRVSVSSGQYWVDLSLLAFGLTAAASSDI